MKYPRAIIEQIGIDHPIFQGPFGGGLSTVQLTAAVSEAGGLGGYGAYTLDPAEIVAVNQRIRELTKRPYNLNLWISDTDTPGITVADEVYTKLCTLFEPYFQSVGMDLPQKPEPVYSRFESQVEAILDARPPVFSFVFGIPSQEILEACRRKSIKTVGTASSLAEALALENAGVDMIVASGFEGGGHRPSFLARAEDSMNGSFVLVQLIKEKVRIPVIAAGGIVNGRGAGAAFLLGADAVQIGTAFLACIESGASAFHREMILSGSNKETTLSRVYTGRLGRVIKNEITEAAKGNEEALLSFPQQAHFMSALRRAAIEQSKLGLISFWCGQAGPLVREKRVDDLMGSIIREISELPGN